MNVIDLPTVLTAILVAVAPGQAQMEPVVADTFDSPATAALIRRARGRRGEAYEGLASYEAVVRERLFAGLAVRGFRRERSLYRSERVARVRWQAEGPETIEWLGSRQQVPIAGGAEVEDDSHEELRTFPLDPMGDRLALGGTDFLHPLADSAGRHYRFSGGDTTRIELPAVGRSIVMAEVRFEARRPDFQLLSGSLWFDVASATLVRGVFRPSREFDLEIDEPGEAEDVPGFLKPIVFEVEAMIVEFGLYDLAWWLPHRVRFDGTGRMGGVARIPLSLESVAESMDVDGQVLDPERPAPAGWERIALDEDGNEALDGMEPHRIVYMPPDSALRASEWLSADNFTDGSDAFSPAELDEIRGLLDELPAPEPAMARPSLKFGRFRYNRVEALSAGVLGRAPLGGAWTGAAEFRLGVADLHPGGALSIGRPIRSGRLEARAYGELRPAGDWGRPFGPAASASALVLGYDDGQYFRAYGADVAFVGAFLGLGAEARVFMERHRAAEKNTDVSLANLLGEADMSPNITADPLDAVGLSFLLRAQSGSDPDDWIVLGWLGAEAAGGTRAWSRLRGGAGVSRPIAGPVAVSIEAEAGVTGGDPPVQRMWFLGGPETLRGFPGGEVSGESFGRARLEVGVGLTAVRLAAFGDAAWAGYAAAFLDSGPAVSAGLGFSALDGLFRLDVAQVIRGRDPRHLRVHVYFDGLL